jgi:methylenetetrahydrofolate reductase (NADPH)
MENHILKAQHERSVMYSFEFFPPKDEAGEERLWNAIEALESIAPDFVSVTYGAGGSTRDRTIRIASEISTRTNITTVAHLTCVGSTEDELREILASYSSAGISNVLALRGDPVGGPRAPWVTTAGGYEHADQLVTLAQSMNFNVGVASFPDVHPNSDGNFEKDIDVLLEKERRGATFSTTQFFFEVDKWKKLVDALSSRGSSLPIFPGILPVTNVKQLHRMAELSGTPIPSQLANRLLAASDSPSDVYKIGVEHAIAMCQQLIEAGAPGIHFYTMNASPATREIFEEIKGIRK